MPDRQTITDFFRQLQDDICRQLQAADGGTPFRQDEWDRPGGGGGRARVLNGQRIEKGGVNFSAVHGELPERALRALQMTEGKAFYATGVSIVLHPRNPYAPIIHMNVRYFEMDSGVWWFGGGIDLTPHYIVPQDAAWFHGQLKEVCDRYDDNFYPGFKTWADNYFYLPHREETRGVGGIFFDRLNDTSGLPKETLFSFVQDVGRAFAPLYTELLGRHCDAAFGERQIAWQQLRRGRYVEFNLVWDRGTKFGLETDGRTESILMSLPPLAGWVYDHRPEAGSPEAFTQEHLRKDIDWLQHQA